MPIRINGIDKLVSITFLYSIFVANLAIRSVRHFVCHLVIMVAVVAFNPMQANSSNVARKLLV